MMMQRKITPSKSYQLHGALADTVGPHIDAYPGLFSPAKYNADLPSHDLNVTSLDYMGRDIDMGDLGVLPVVDACRVAGGDYAEFIIAQLLENRGILASFMDQARTSGLRANVVTTHQQMNGIAYVTVGAHEALKDAGMSDIVPGIAISRGTAAISALGMTLPELLQHGMRVSLRIPRTETVNELVRNGLIDNRLIAGHNSSARESTRAWQDTDPKNHIQFESWHGTTMKNQYAEDGSPQSIHLGTISHGTVRDLTGSLVLPIAMMEGRHGHQNMLTIGEPVEVKDGQSGYKSVNEIQDWQASRVANAAGVDQVTFVKVKAT